ncbi:MAG: bifunctional nicotinamidase/pyrazinamidase [bacterium]|nr:bifunctional nicotinamidase/pyrazinamidase [bacterium]
MADTALLIVDVQNDFCPGGALPVPEGDQVVPVLNQAIERFQQAGAPIIASRDWHPERSTHFAAYGGKWPVHCVQRTEGAAFHPDLRLPEDAIVVSKGMGENEDGYSAFEARTDDGTPLESLLREKGIRRLVVGGLATDYCVRASVLGALERGIEVLVLQDAIRGVDVQPGDSERALAEMQQKGAKLVSLEEVDLS